MKQKLLVSQIQNFSLHDGPGIRTTVFLQGCNLRCKWCHNPETWKKESILSYTENKCIGCGQCIEICPSGAQQIQNGQHIYERTLCTVCGKCVEICCTEALEIVGSYYSVEELSELLLRDRRLYEISEGGVTFSGGEPMMQAEILYDLCNRLQKEHISVAFETALAFPWKVIHRMTECADLFLVDFKKIALKNKGTANQTKAKVVLGVIHNLRHLKLVPIKSSRAFSAPFCVAYILSKHHVCRLYGYPR